LCVPIDGDIFCVGLSEEAGIFFESGSFVEEGGFPVDLFDLFGFEVVLGFEFCDFCEFFIDVAYSFL
jgi:hypothetical protein